LVRRNLDISGLEFEPEEQFPDEDEPVDEEDFDES